MREHILELLGRYLSGPFKIRGTEIIHKCPFHKEGLERHPSFGVSLLTGDFNCFACHEAGSLKLLLKKLGAPRSTIDKDLKEIEAELSKASSLRKLKSENFLVGKDPFKAPTCLPEAILGVFDWMPLSLKDKGFDTALLQDMDIGFDVNNERITYPIRDVYGNLAGISGGATKPDQIPKYKVYQGGKFNGSLWQPSDFGKWFDDEYPGFRCENHHFLWNFDRVLPRISSATKPLDVYVVEGFKACLWMIQVGFKNTVAAMGSHLSEHQQRLLHRLGGNVVLCFDNDEAGKKATRTVGRMLWKPLHGRVRVVQYPAGHFNTQPDDYNRSDLTQMVETAVPYHSLFGGNLVSPRRQQNHGNDIIP